MCCQISGLFNMVMVSENDLSDIYKEEVGHFIGELFDLWILGDVYL